MQIGPAVRLKKLAVVPVGGFLVPSDLCIRSTPND